MSRFGKPGRRDAWLAAATCVFLLAAIASAIQLYRLESALLSSLRSGNWLIAEAQSELHHTMIASQQFRLDPTEAALAELSVRFDVFWSRIPLILSSDEGVDIRDIEAVRRNATEIRDMLPALDAELAKVRPGDADSARAFEQLLHGLDPLADEMARMTLLQDETRYRNENVAHGTALTVGMFLLSVLAGVALAVGNLLHRRRLQSLYQQQIEIDQVRAAQLTAIESSGEGIAMFDGRGCLTYSNETFHKLIEDDFSRTLTRASWRRFVVRAGAEAILRGLREGDGRAWKGEVAGRALDGGERSWEVAVTQAHDGGFVALIRDLAEQKAHERDRALLQEQMHRVEKMEAVGRLAGGVAHDFNNILAAITGYGSILQSDLAEQPTRRGMVDQILIAAGRGKELVQSILAFSRAEKAERRSIDVAAACREAATMAAMSIEGPAVFETDFAGGSMPAIANATQITRAVLNLCLNARDALPNGKGKVRLEVARVEIDGGCTSGLRGANTAKADEALMRFEAAGPGRARGWIGALAGTGPHVRIRVSDDGSGIPLDVMAQIFDPFFTTKEVGRGTGLGLSSVLGIASAHGGAIAIDSVVDGGTTFDLLLPIERSATADAPVTLRQDGTVAADHRKIVGTRVLLVDDDPDVGKTMMAVLERLGCEPSLCNSGAEALELLADEPNLFDLMITDLMMPRMSGVELAAELRARGSDIPIVLASGRLQDASTQERTRLGIEFTISKPFMLREVAGAIWSVVGRRQASSQAKAAPEQGVGADGTE